MLQIQPLYMGMSGPNHLKFSWIINRQKCTPTVLFGCCTCRAGKFHFYLSSGIWRRDQIKKKTRLYSIFLKTSTSDSIVFDSSYVFPKKDWELQPGDIFKAAVKGSPGNKVTFSIEGLVNNLPMKELTSKKRHYWGEALFHQRTNYQMSEVKGIYTGSYFINRGTGLRGDKLLSN